LKTWATRPGRGDLLGNIVLYLPLGYFCLRVLPSRIGGPWRVLLTVFAGAMLSCGIELTQYYDQGRVTSAGDVYTNVFGTFVGAASGQLFGRDIGVPLFREIRSRPFPTLLIASWLGYRLYPYVPTIDLHKYWEAVQPIVLRPEVTLYNSFRYAVMWLTVGALLEAVADRRRSRWLFPLLAGAILFAKILIISQEVTLDEIVGIAAGYIIWLVLVVLPERPRALLVALPLFAYVVLWRLEPFHFSTVARPFGWIPFYSLLNGSFEVNTESYLEKVFYYGSLIWLMARAGLPIWLCGILVSAILLAVSGAEIYLPSRSAEVTDAIMALIIAFLASHLAGEDAAVEKNPARRRRRRRTAFD
jgi:VanZ family protein